MKLTETNDRVYKCAPPGMPYIYIQIFPMQIIQTAREVIRLFEYDHTVRHIFIDGRKHPADLKPSYNGHSIGHWEGDAGRRYHRPQREKTGWIVWAIRYRQMHIVEHIRRLDEQSCRSISTSMTPRATQNRGARKSVSAFIRTWSILEHICEDNLAFEGFEK